MQPAFLRGLTLAITCRRQAAKPAVAGQVHRVVGPRAAMCYAIHTSSLKKPSKNSTTDFLRRARRAA